MIAFFAIDGYNWDLIDTNYRIGYTLMCVGMVIAGGIFVSIVVLFKKSVWHVWNIFFAFAIVMAVLAVLTPRIGTSVPRHFFSGLTQLGWIASLYMLACAQRRFASYKLLKKCTVIFVILSPITTLSDDVVSAFFPEAVPAATLALVLVIVIGFMMTSPYSYKYLFSAVWLADLHKGDMTMINEKMGDVDRMDKYKLTIREKEIAALLLAANTMRMISGELRISESTVKMHTSNLYKKLGIRSRVELFRLFGAPEIPEEMPAGE
jgi:DNA-binding CsgD family transcriptional regulator